MMDILKCILDIHKYKGINSKIAPYINGALFPFYSLFKDILISF